MPFLRREKKENTIVLLVLREQRKFDFNFFKGESGSIKLFFYIWQELIHLQWKECLLINGCVILSTKKWPSGPSSGLLVFTNKMLGIIGLSPLADTLVSSHNSYRQSFLKLWR